jgi:hypothetical protein
MSLDDDLIECLQVELGHLERVYGALESTYPLHFQRKSVIQLKSKLQTHLNLHMKVASNGHNLLDLFTKKNLKKQKNIFK